MKKIVIVAVVIVALAAGGGYVGLRWWRSTPDYALSQVRKSFEEHDIMLFREYVDLDTVLDRGVDSLLSTMPEQEEGWANALAEGLVKMMKPALISEVKKAVESMIESGKLPEPSTQGNAPGVAAQGGKIDQMGDIQYKGIGAKNREGKTTRVTLNLHHVKYDHDFDIELLMRETPQGHLQIAEIANLTEVMKELDAEEAKWKEGQNRPFREKIDAALKVVGIAKSTRQDQWGIDRKIIFTATAKNTSSKTITRIEGDLSAATTTEPPQSKSWPVNFDGAIPPGTDKAITWEMDANQFIADESAIFNAAPEKLTITLTVKLLRFGDGEEVALPYR